MSTEAPEYKFCKKLAGVKGAINVLIFTKDGKLLLSGGDDECVRIWNTQDFSCEQVLHNAKWGQVTALTWINVEPSIEGISTSICVGTGRGSVDLCPMSKESTWFLWKSAAFFTPFVFNDAVEAQAYDPLNRRLAVASHSGQVKLFNVEQCVTLVPVWTANIGNAIPRGLAFFGGANQSLLTHGLETGEMSCRDAQNSNVLWTKTLVGGIGHASLSSDETILLVDNLTTGTFDAYRFPASTPCTTFSLTSTRRFAKQCVFAEGGKVAVCGSDHSRVHVVDVTSGECLQSLSLGTEHELIQAVASTTMDSGRFLIAGGSSSGTPGISIWEKKLPETTSPKSTLSAEPEVPPITVGSGSSELTQQALINTLFTVLIILVSYPNWSPFFWKFVAWISVMLAHGANILATLSSTPDAIPAVDVAQLVDMDVGPAKNVIRL